MKVLIMLAAVACGVAQAQSPDTQAVRQVTVSIADLNLNSDAGLEALYRRLKGAASTACAGSDTGDRLNFAFEKCRQAAVERAVAGFPALAKYDARRKEKRLAKVG